MIRYNPINFGLQKLLQNVISTDLREQYQRISVIKMKTWATTNNLTSNAKTHSLVQSTLETRTEKEFLVGLKNDPDSFGDSSEQETFDEGDLKEEKYFEKPFPSQKLRTKQYADMIKAFIRKRKIKEAIDVLEMKMLKEDQVKPEAYIYNLLLGACGRVGYTKKAFSLYNQMKKRGLKVMGGTYTALFNACANSPWPEDGLTRAKHLRHIMIEKMHEPNHTNYNAMIKAFGRCGDLTTAFELVDEMSAKKLPIKDDTINFLLQACIQDKEAGFRHALLVWRKMVNKNIAPSLYTYNLMIRCIRDCGFGSTEVMKITLEEILNEDVHQLESYDNKLVIGCSHDEKPLLQSASNFKKYDTKSTVVAKSADVIDEKSRPNLIAKVPHLGNIISLSEVTKPEDRLLLVGGLKGVLINMNENNCKPDIKSFTQLLDCLPGNIAAENELQNYMKKFNIKPDIDFFNMLIKKRSIRFDYGSAKAVVDEMRNFNYRPNLMTYGVLALGCKTKNEAIELITEMTENSYRLNAEILGAMLHQACYHKNFPYVLEIMEVSLKENVKPNKIFMECLKDFKNNCKDITNDKEHKLSQNTLFLKGFLKFQKRYKTWIEEVEVDDSEETHPWTQYRENINTDVRHYKDKSQRFKAIHSSRYKVKTSTKHRW